MGHYMTKEERIIMQTLLDEKKPVSYIARKLGCCRQTVYNEIRRGQYLHDYGYYDKLRYSADKGQQIHDYNQTAKGRPLKIGSDHAFAAYIEHKIIVDRYSPAAALAAARKYPFATRISSYAGLQPVEQEPPQHIAEAADHGPLQSVPKSHDLSPVLSPCVAETPPHGVEYLKLVHVIYRPAIAESLSALYCCTSRVYLGFSTVGRSLIRRWNSCMP